MLIFLLVPIQENENTEIPSPYCLGTIPTDNSYKSEDTKIWLRKIFKLAKKFKFKLIGKISFVLILMFNFYFI